MAPESIDNTATNGLASKSSLEELLEFDSLVAQNVPEAPEEALRFPLPDEVSQVDSSDDILLPLSNATPASSVVRAPSPPQRGEPPARNSYQSSHSSSPAQIPGSQSSRHDLIPENVALPGSPLSSTRSVSPEDVPLPSSSASSDHSSVPDRRDRHQPGREEFVQRRATTGLDLRRDVISANNELSDYRARRQRIARKSKHFPELGIEDCRNREATTTIYFDYHSDSSLVGPNRVEALDLLRELPGVKPKLRCVLLEDLEPTKIDFIGAAFGLDARFFGTHLRDSGYAHFSDQDSATNTWSSFQATGQHCSIKWLRPIMPSLVVSSRLRDKLLSGRTTRAPCVRKCEVGRHEVKTEQNIFRRALGLSASQDSSETSFPMGWEERITVSKVSDETVDCDVLVVCLDPLPALQYVGSGHSVISESRYYIPQDVEAQPLARPIMLPPPPPAMRRNTAKFKKKLPARGYLRGPVPPPPPIPPPPPLPPLPDLSQLPPPGVSITAENSSRDGQAAVTGSPTAGQPSAMTTATSEPSRRPLSSAPPVIPALPVLPPPPMPARTPGVPTPVPGFSFSSGLAPPPPMPNVPLPPPPERLVQPRTKKDAPREPPKAEIRRPRQVRELKVHKNFIPFNSIASRGPHDSHLDYDDVEGDDGKVPRPSSTLELMVQSLSSHRLPTSFSRPSPDDVAVTMLQIIHHDTELLVEIVQASLQEINRLSVDMRPAQLQEHAQHWRSLLSRFQYELRQILEKLPAFRDFFFRNEDGSYKADRPEHILPRVEETLRLLREALTQIDSAYGSLRAELQIADARRSIEEAENVARLTEIAFIFIPITLAASLFSMQIKELESPAPVGYFIATSLSLILLAYMVRLAVRNRAIQRYRTECFTMAREHAGLSDQEPLTTRQFVAWVGIETWQNVSSVFINFVDRNAGLIILLIVAVLLSLPIIFLWRRDFDHGYTSMMTVLIVAVDLSILYVIRPLLLSDWNPREIASFLVKSKRRTKKKHRRDSASSSDGDEDIYGRPVSMASSAG